MIFHADFSSSPDVVSITDELAAPRTIIGAETVEGMGAGFGRKNSIMLCCGFFCSASYFFPAVIHAGFI